uniref:Uncharacterized protein n=1 Tax=Cyprinus carpio TaxID=7962 RepID=A0A8C2H5W5_CYPCA
MISLRGKFRGGVRVGPLYEFVMFCYVLRQFDNYLLAIGGDKVTDERKRALLIHCLGAEGQRLYNTLPLEHDEYSRTVSALTTFFQPKVNVVAERYRFRQRAQLVGELTDHYIAALRELVATCTFGTFKNEILCDQLIKKTSVPRIRKRFLLESDLTLDKALEIASEKKNQLLLTAIIVAPPVTWQIMHLVLPKMQNVNPVQRLAILLKYANLKKRWSMNLLCQK